MKTTNSWILLAQICYLGMAVSYNLISLMLILRGRMPLAPTKKLPALAVLGLYGSSLLLPGYGNVRMYVMALMIFILLSGWSGIYQHLARGSVPGVYRSALSRFCAIAINIFGLLVNCCAVYFARDLFLQ